MQNKDEQIYALEKQVQSLQSRVRYLEKILDKANISYDRNYTENVTSESKQFNETQGERIIPVTVTKNHVKYFYSMFKGRMDVYSKRAGKPNAKSGKTGYYTQCWNFWKDGLCPKKKGIKVKCADCANQKYKQLTGDDLMNHLIGSREDCSDVIGLYPMFPDETCNFLVFDFDNHNEDNTLDDGANTDNEWIDEVNAMRDICVKNGVDVLVERSRSGKGAHVWVFFEEAISATLARRFGHALLTKGAHHLSRVENRMQILAYYVNNSDTKYVSSGIKLIEE